MERTYTIPLRKSFLKTPIYLRTNKAVRTVRQYLQRHMKTDQVKLGEELNSLLWARGNKRPPTRVTVLAKKEENVVYAELAGKEFRKKNFSDSDEESKKETRGLPTAVPEPKDAATETREKPTEASATTVATSDKKTDAKLAPKTQAKPARKK